MQDRVQQLEGLRAPQAVSQVPAVLLALGRGQRTQQVAGVVEASRIAHITLQPRRAPAAAPDAGTVWR